MIKRLIAMLCCSVFFSFAQAQLSSEQALQQVIDAARNGDASDITVDVLNSIDGIDAREDLLSDYRDIIENNLDPDDDEFLVELQEFVASINETPADVGEQTLNTAMEENWRDERYSVNSNGTILDSVTGLLWMRCSVSQEFSDNECVDPEDENYTVFTWAGALATAADVNGSGFAGFNDWRVPNINELASLVARNRFSPAVNQTIFVDVFRDNYWTSSPYFFDGTQSWQVSLFDGNDGPQDRANEAHVILVRDAD